MKSRGLAQTISLGALGTLVGCGAIEDALSFDTSFFDDAGIPVGAGIGEACRSDGDCISGRSCLDNVCSPGGSGSSGQSCWATADCAADFYCDGAEGTCAPAGEAAVGESCTSVADCLAGLTCELVGLATVCSESTGTTDVGRACAQPSECMAGLTCGPNPVLDLSDENRQLIPDSLQVDTESETVCVPSNFSVGLPSWPGVECEPVADDAAREAYFVMPKDNSADFFRLPFPNDIRRTEAGIDLTGFPTPGPLLGFDFVQLYVDEAEQRLDGFSTNPNVYFRFSHPYQSNSVDPESVLLFRLDPESPGYGRPLARSWNVSAGPITKYVCDNWLGVRSPAGRPLVGGSPYAAVLTKDIVPTDGAAFEVSPSLLALLDDQAPADAELQAAHAAYEPLRRLIADGHLQKADILNASVFTTQKPQALIPELRQVIRTGEPPSVADLTVCESGTTSPCDDGDTRVCQNQAGTIEVHGRLSLPNFQQGTAPYESSGGGIDLGTDGVPVLAGTTDVCFALTLPTGLEMPETGYPLVVYAHGTGGSFTSGIQNGVATAAAAAGSASLGFDLPQHGSRANGSSRGEDELFFNFLNPPAARDNVNQGAADLMAVIYWAEQFNAAAEDTPLGTPVRFDSERLVLYGHSQGATHGSLIVPHEHALHGAILSGLGGDLGLALTHKRAPIDIASVVPIALLDPEAAAPSLCPPGLNCLGANHPVLSLLQGVFDSVDAVNFGAGIKRPPEGGTVKHFLQTIGRDDTYSPDPTLAAYALSTGLQLAPLSSFDVHDGVTVADAPISGNTSQTLESGERVVTQALRNYVPAAGADGHFVAFDVARADVENFLQAMLVGDTPVIGD